MPGASGRVLGPRVARWLAAVVLRAKARSGTGRLREGQRAGTGPRRRRGKVVSGSAEGWLEGVHRVATRSAPGAPRLTRLPASWWTTSPRVRVRRLGLRLDLDLRDNLQRALYATGTYEPAVLQFLHDELRPGDVVVDLGAHIGVHSLTSAARLRRLARHRRRDPGTVIAFEPARDAARLRAAAARNGLMVTVVEAALGAESGTGELGADPAYDPADAGVRSLHGTGTRVQAVPVITFDAWAAERGVGRLALVKVDVEGAELAVLEGMAGALARLRPRALVIEVKQRVLDRAGVAGDEVRELLDRLGY